MYYDSLVLVTNTRDSDDDNPPICITTSYYAAQAALIKHVENKVNVTENQNWGTPVILKSERDYLDNEFTPKRYLDWEYYAKRMLYRPLSPLDTQEKELDFIIRVAEYSKESKLWYITTWTFAAITLPTFTFNK